MGRLSTKLRKHPSPSVLRNLSYNYYYLYNFIIFCVVVLIGSIYDYILCFETEVLCIIILYIYIYMYVYVFCHFLCNGVGNFVYCVL